MADPSVLAGGSRKGKEKAVDLDTPSAASSIQTKEAQQAKGGWSSSKNERAALLKRRREDMVLEARRKMQARVEGRGA